MKGTLQVPGDKSVSHRALIFSALAKGECFIKRLSPAEDCQSTIRCLQALGMGVHEQLRTTELADKTLVLESPGLKGFKQASGPLDCGNSGTTMRLLAGLLAGLKFESTLCGDASLSKRPMSRVLAPLAEMGTLVTFEERDGYAPFSVQGGQLQGKIFKLPVASAQVHTALLLAGLQSEGETTVTLPAPVRDHTERMFRHIGVPFEMEGTLSTSVSRLAGPVAPFEITVPGDISSAAFFMVAAACMDGSDLTLTDVGMNSGRTLVIDVLKEMGAAIEVKNEREVGGEPVASIQIRGGQRLKGATISGDRIAAGIDEVPILALAGAFCDGILSVRDASELRVKESDRLSAIVHNLRRAGACATEFPDGFDIEGKASLAGGSEWNTFGDHRLAMTGMVASLLCDRPVQIDDKDCAAVSYPYFEKDLQTLQ